MIPPFIMVNEQVIERSHPEMAPCNQKFSVIAEPDVSRVINTSSSYSSDWGYVLRVVYKGQVDGVELKADQIFVCWRNAGGATHFIVSPMDDEAGLRGNALKHR